MKKNSEKGVLMVEAAIYMPLVIAIVIFLLYLAFFNMQEFLMMYEAQRVAAVAARETAYPGYSVFGMGQNNQIDFYWGDDLAASLPDTEAYYKSQHSNPANMYREFGELAKDLGLSSDETSFETRFSDSLRNASLISLGTISDPEVNINYGLLGDSVTVTFTHKIPQPGIFKYLELDVDTTMKGTAYSYAVNPTSFARTVNLASDLVDFIMKKVGCSGKWDELKEKASNILGQIF